MIKSFFIRNFPKLGIRYRYITKYGYEPEMKILNNLVDKRNSIDVGAHLGNYTYLLSRISQKTYAFEPNIFLSNLLENANLVNTKVFNIALSSECSYSCLKIPKIDGIFRFGNAFLGNNSFLDKEYYDLAVKTMMLDSYNFKDIGLIKVDVEGHEISVIKGAIQTIEQSLPNLLIEINDNFLYKINRILSLLPNKYQPVVFDNNRYIDAIYYYNINKNYYNNNILFLRK